MRKKIAKMIIFIAAITILLTDGCQKKAANEHGTSIYYSAIESGDYYEGWANQLEEAAKQHGFTFQVGYAENSIETQDAQIKKAVSEGCNVFLCGPVSSDIVTEIKVAADGGPINSLLMQIGFIDEPYKFLSNTGSARGIIAFLNCLMWFGNTTILLMAGMMGIDTSLFEAAEVDGATFTQIFLHVTLPLLRPILVYVLITSLLGGLQLFDVPQILTNGTGDPVRTTMTMVMFLNKHLYSKNYGMAGALSVVLFIITGILSLIVFKVTGNDKRKG